MNHWTNLRTDRLFLGKYLVVHNVVVLAILALQLRAADLDELLNDELAYWPLALLPLGLIVAVQIPVLIHNTVHRNLRPRFLKFVAGELAGHYVLLSMASFELNHVMHHAHPDSDLEPHNPYQWNFFGFFFPTTSAEPAWSSRSTSSTRGISSSRRTSSTCPFSRTSTS